MYINVLDNLFISLINFIFEMAFGSVFVGTQKHRSRGYCDERQIAPANTWSVVLSS